MPLLKFLYLFWLIFAFFLTGGLVECLRFLLVDLFLSTNYDMWTLSSLKVPECRGITYFWGFDQHPTKGDLQKSLFSVCEWVQILSSDGGCWCYRDRSIRVWLDPKDLNVAIEREHYPLPR